MYQPQKSPLTFLTFKALLTEIIIFFLPHQYCYLLESTYGHNFFLLLPQCIFIKLSVDSISKAIEFFKALLEL